MRYEPTGRTVTPEAVLLRTDVAGIGSRSIALLVDLLIQAVVLIPVIMAFGGDGLADMGESALLALALFVILWLYFPVFEWLNDGQTPGKRLQRIREVRTTGLPAGFAPVMVRNLIRLIEVYALPFVALLAMFFSPRVQRLGDVAAGTMVIRDRPMPAPQAMAAVPIHPSAPVLDTMRLTEREYTLMRSFLARRSSLDAAAGNQLAANLATMLRRQLGDQPAVASLSDEELIRAAVQSYRARFSEGG